MVNYSNKKVLNRFRNPSYSRKSPFYSRGGGGGKVRKIKGNITKVNMIERGQESCILIYTFWNL